MNAKVEFLEHTKDLPKVICAVIGKDRNYKQVHLATLFEDYTQDEYNKFLSILDDYNYDDGYGHQELYGVIWYEDGTYSDRYEYDGSESWDYHKAPEKPKRTNQRRNKS